MKRKFKKKNLGNTLIETLFYISLFAALSIAVIDSLIVMTKSFKETTIQRDFMQGEVVMGKLVREIRQAKSIASITSTSLRVNTVDDAGINVILGFNFVNGNMEFLKNDVLIGNLNTEDISITDLTFTQIDTALSKAIKITMSISSNKDSFGRVENYYNTVVLRGLY